MASSDTQPDTESAITPTPSLRDRLAGVAGAAGAVIFGMVLVFRYLFQYGVSSVWYADGAAQHIPGFLYVHEWMTALLSGQAANFGMWTWRLGLGADTLSTISYYIGDPFALLAIPFPVQSLEYVLEWLFFLKILCAGLAAYYYLRTMKAKRLGAIAGTLVYVFTGFMLQLCLRHIWFGDALIYFPLILVGVEKVLARKRWYLLVAMFAIAASGDFYFFYEMAIIAVIYAVARYVEIAKPGERLRRLLPEGLRIGGWYALGTILATFMLLPLALAILSSSREASAFGMPLFYDLKTYLGFIVSLATAKGGPHSFSGGFAAVGLIAAAVVFMRRGELALKTMLVAFVAFVVFPVFGRLFNGFAFPSYRFFFMFGLFLALCVAKLLSDDRPLSRRELIVTGVGLAAFAAFDAYACRQLGFPLLMVAVPLGLGALAWAVFAVQHFVLERTTPPHRGAAALLARHRWVFGASILAIVFAGIAAAGVATYSERYNPMLKQYLPSGTVVQMYLDDPGSQASKLPTDGLQRVDKQVRVLTSGLGVTRSNDPLVQGYAGLDFYYSIMADGVHEYATGLADRNMRMAFDIEGFDDRAALDTLNAVRYYLAPASGQQYVPYGFTATSTIGTDTVYENRYALPIGYMYHSAVTPAAYDAMSPLDKQQSLLQGVVIADGLAPSVARVQPATETVDVPYTLTPGQGLKWDQTALTFATSKKNASFDLTFAAVPDAELYVDMTGVTFRGTARLNIAVDTGGARKLKSFRPPSDNYYYGDQTLLVNLGYFPKGTTHARVTFVAKDTYRYTSLRVVAVPMTRYPEHVGKLAAEGMRDVKVSADAVSGTVTSNGDGVLFLSIPYSKGWSATVDGAPAPIFTANVGFSGIAIASGTHSVGLRYVTPGLTTGAMVSVLALLLAIGLAILTERRIAATRRLASTSAAAAPSTPEPRTPRRNHGHRA